MMQRGHRVLSASTLQIFRSLSTVPSLNENKLKILDTHINYAETESKSTKTPILFLPGAFGSIEMDFRPIAESLTGNYKWYAYDPPGYGKSIPPKRPFMSDLRETVHELDVDYILGLMEKLGHKSYNVVAWSGAALSAFWIASRNPEKITSLVTFGSFGCVLDKQLPQVHKMKSLGLDAIPESRKSKLIEMYGKEYLLQMWIGWCDEAVRMTTSATYKKGGTFQKTLESVRCPTLIMQGTNDKLVTMEQAEHLRDSVRGAKLLIVEKGTHNLHLRNTASFVGEIERFFDSVSNKSS